MDWTSLGLEMLLCGDMLRSRLPYPDWKYSIVGQGIMISRLDEHMRSHDVMFRGFDKLGTFAEWTAFMDEITKVVSDQIIKEHKEGRKEP